ncbi:glycosyltransferase [Rossellomorea sp. BNER]|uniref:glycosyltransferase n=1 Tax=Rossellomorea sp. BNER TaxID=2962031 RepID=UPI003AF204D4|nr:glycosyltransferase [Rossellomorea sp. BNER]
MNSCQNVVILPSHLGFSPLECKKNESDTLVELVLEEFLGVIDLCEHEQETKLIVVSPLILEWLITDDFKERANTYFKNKLSENQQYQKSFSQWLNCQEDIPAALQKLQEKQKLIIIPTSLSHFPLTHLLTDIGIDIQINGAISIYKKVFGKKPKGFWLPYCAYLPGLDLYLTENGIEYSFISSYSYQFSEKDSDENMILRTPRGLKLIPLEKNHKNGNYFLPTISASGSETLHFSEEIWLSHPTSLSRVGFGYLEMESEKTLFSDEEIKQLMVIHEMERNLKKASLTESSSSRLLDQLVTEWAHYLLMYQNDDEVSVSCKQAFQNIYQYIIKNDSDSHFVSYREQFTSHPSDLTIGQWRNEKKVEEKRKEAEAILLLSWEYPPFIVGGLARHVHDLSKALVKKGKRVIVLTAKNDEGLPYEVADGVEVYRVHPLQQFEENFLHWVAQLNLALFEKAAEIMNSQRIDVIHAHDWVVGMAAINLKKNLSKPLVTTIHATEHGRNKGIYTDLQKQIHHQEEKLIQASNQIIVCSEFMKQEVQEVFPVGEYPLNIIPNGVNIWEVERGSIEDKRETNKPFFLSIGRVVKEKGFDTLMEMASMLRSQWDGQFLIAGKGPLLEHYRQIVKDKNLEDYIQFIGFIDDDKRNELLEKCEAVIFPSVYEPFGIVALEAMAAKKAVIASKTGGLKGIVQHGHAGLLFEPENPESLKFQVESILKEEGLKEKLGNSGFKLAQMLFSWERISDQTLKVYEEVSLNKKMEGSYL